MRSTTVTLAGKSYVVQSKPMKANREWRKKFEEPINLLFGAVNTIGDLSKREFEKPADLFKEIGAVLIQRAGDIMNVVIKSPDLLADAVFSYAPELEADRAFIEENAYDEEMGAAFLEVVKLVYPFSGMMEKLTKLGQTAQATAQSSSSPNTDDTKTSSTK